MTDREVAITLQCVDCGTSAERTSVSLHPGAVSAPSDEGHVRRTRDSVPLLRRGHSTQMGAVEDHVRPPHAACNRSCCS